MTDTPRTDAVFKREMNVQLDGFILLCRQLERELNAARESLLACDERIKAEERRASGHELSRRLAEEHCKRMSNERDKLRRELSMLKRAWNKQHDPYNYFDKV